MRLDFPGIDTAKRIKLLVALAGLLLGAPASAGTLTVDLSTDDPEVKEVEVTLICDAPVLEAPARVDARTSHVFDIALEDGVQSRCRIEAEAPAGKVIRYRSDGGSNLPESEDVCEFSQISRGDANYCLLIVDDEVTEITVYVRWIGGNSTEVPVESWLLCEGLAPRGPQWLNPGQSVSWKLQQVPPEGLECTVAEKVTEEFTADMDDCRDLHIQPGIDEACTLINTKVVKRIEMLNRYGVGVMILVIFLVGLLAIRRLA